MLDQEFQLDPVVVQECQAENQVQDEHVCSFYRLIFPFTLENQLKT